MNSTKRKPRSCVKRIIIAVCLLSLIFYLISSPNITIKRILDFTPDNPWLQLIFAAYFAGEC